MHFVVKKTIWGSHHYYAIYFFPSMGKIVKQLLLNISKTGRILVLKKLKKKELS